MRIACGRLGSATRGADAGVAFVRRRWWRFGAIATTIGRRGSRRLRSGPIATRALRFGWRRRLALTLAGGFVGAVAPSAGGPVVAARASRRWRTGCGAVATRRDGRWWWRRRDVATMFAAGVSGVLGVLALVLFVGRPADGWIVGKCCLAGANQISLATLTHGGTRRIRNGDASTSFRVSSANRKAMRISVCMSITGPEDVQTMVTHNVRAFGVWKH